MTIEKTKTIRLTMVELKQWLFKENMEMLLYGNAAVPVNTMIKQCLKRISEAEQKMPGTEWAVSLIDEKGIHIRSIERPKKKQEQYLH